MLKEVFTAEEGACLLKRRFIAGGGVLLLEEAFTVEGVPAEGVLLLEEAFYCWRRRLLLKKAFSC